MKEIGFESNISPAITIKAIRENLAWRSMVVALVVLLGFGARLLIATLGHNYDLDSYMQVTRLVEQGQNVYANTYRYNYGPLWFNLLYFLYTLAGKDWSVFRFLISGALSLVDIGIFAILWRKVGRTPALLFYLNPVSMIITGFHSQFDNLAILLAMLSVLLLPEQAERGFGKRKLAGLLVLGLSITLKHVFFAFPFWLALKQKGLRQKALALLLPVAVFLLSFLPYWSTGGSGILHNVFFYQSLSNGPFYKWFVPLVLKNFIDTRLLWFFALAAFAFFFRKTDAFHSLLYYTFVLVVFSPAITNQYLAIVVPYISVTVNLFTLLYTSLGTLFLASNSNGLHLDFLSAFAISQNMYYSLLVTLLGLGFAWQFWAAPIRAAWQKAWSEIRLQFTPDQT